MYWSDPRAVAHPQARDGRQRPNHLKLNLLHQHSSEADAREKFVQDFVAAWSRVMNLDRFDLA
jgi:catalase (peroxidase I)